MKSEKTSSSKTLRLFFLDSYAIKVPTKPLVYSLAILKLDTIPWVINIYCLCFRKWSHDCIFKDKKKTTVAICLVFLNMTNFCQAWKKGIKSVFPNFQANYHCACIVYLHMCYTAHWTCPVEVMCSRCTRFTMNALHITCSHISFGDCVPRKWEL